MKPVGPRRILGPAPDHAGGKTLSALRPLPDGFTTDGAQSCVVAAKRYRGAEHRDFQRSATYTEGRRVRNSRDSRAMARKSAYGRKVEAGQWAWAEWESLKRCYSAGLPVPYPIQIDGSEILMELESDRAMLDTLTAKIVAEGLATLAEPGGKDDKVLIVRGTSHLLDSVEAQADIERVRTLFDDIERKADLIRLLELAKDGDGVRIFIGSENRLFSLSGSSIVAAPYANAAGKIVGVIGVLGPTRLNYGRIIPMVDHTAKVIGRLLG